MRLDAMADGGVVSFSTAFSQEGMAVDTVRTHVTHPKTDLGIRDKGGGDLQPAFYGGSHTAGQECTGPMSSVFQISIFLYYYLGVFSCL